MAKLKNIHPGEILSEEFLTPFNISAYKLAKDIEIPQTRISEIVKGNRRITAAYSSCRIAITAKSIRPRNWSI